MRPSQIAFVLHRPSSAENIGAVARVLANFGISRLELVAPASWEGPARGGEGRSGGEDVLLRARRTARGGADRLVGAGLHRDLRSALAGFTWACGTSPRVPRGSRSGPRLAARELGPEIARRSAEGPVAVVFGEERRGLSDAELSLCQAVCAIPTDAACPSMNLAQAAAIVAYEIAVAGGAGVAPPPRREPARRATIDALFERLEGLLDGAGYLNPQNPRAIPAEWRQLLARAEPTQREAELLAAGVRALERALSPGPGGKVRG